MVAPELTASRSLDRTRADHWRRWRGPLAVVVLLLVTAVVLGIVQSGARRGFLDPEGVDNVGARALARLLEGQGVRVSPARTVSDVVDAAAPGDTLLVTVPDLLTADQIDRVVDTGARLVLVAARTSVADYAPGLSAVTVGGTDTVEPECALPAAERAGSARLGDIGYSGDVSRSVGARCYPVDGDPALVVSSSAGGSDVVLLGSADPLTNQHLDQDGNAALALGLLGESDHLVWYRPVPEATGGTDGAFTDQLPGWVTAGAWQLAIAAALAAAWRARRLGRLVTEPLPVVVRASETTEGRARLYRRGRSREHAAGLLRTAALRRLNAVAGVPVPPAEALPSGEAGRQPAEALPSGEAGRQPAEALPSGEAGRQPAGEAVAALAAALAARTGLPAAQIAALLAGPPPTDDAGLVRLADDLDALERAGTAPAAGMTPTGKDSRT